MININDIISHWRINKSIPRFIILNNFREDEKDSFIYNLISTVRLDYYRYDNNIESIRNVIKYCYILDKPSIFHIDGDNISIISQNALLKVVEEPPKNIYIILSCNNELLPTIRSRGVEVSNKELPDTDDELINFLDSINNDIKNKLGVNLYKDCNKLKAKETDEDKIDCIEAYNEIKKQLLNIDCKLDNIINSINETNRIMNSSNTNKKMALETFLNDILNEVKNND